MRYALIVVALLCAAPVFAQTPVSFGQPFRDGDITNCPQVYINGVALAATNYQADVKNRWPDGSLKFAIISFIDPGGATGTKSKISYDNITCPSVTPLTKAQLLAAGFNFDAHIVLTGTASPNISARSILNAATACTDPGTDPEGSASLCTYWLQGPVVTAVILEDRAGRSFDVNTDNAVTCPAANGVNCPLHPIFEAWFYPSTNAVMIGYTLENIWSSTTTTSSARAQSYTVSMTAGNTSPVTVYPTSASLTHYVRARWHKVFWLNGTDPFSSLSINQNWAYWATTKFTPSYDTALQIAPSLQNSIINSFNGSNQALVTPPSGSTASGNWPLPNAFNDTGAAFPHGPLTTWDTVNLMSMNPLTFNKGLRAVTLGNADLGSVIPYFHRDADSNSGHGQTFDNSGIVGHVQTQGRMVSVNARTQVSLNDTTAQTCNTNFAADWINYGTGGQNTGPYGVGANMSTSHSGQIAYPAYLLTGQYFYYETTLMQGDYGIGGTMGSRACTQPTANSSLRMGSAGYMYVDQERQMDWGTRDLMVAGFIAVDGSPEKAYLEQKLHANVAVMECARGLTNDYPAESTACTYGSTSRASVSPNTITNSTTLGVWTQGLSAYVNQANVLCSVVGPTCTAAQIAASADSNFQTDYSGLMVGWLDDLGYTPSHGPLNLIANHYINETMNPVSNPNHLADYVFPTLDSTGAQITSWTEDQTFYLNQSTTWPAPGNVTIDDAYGADGVAIMSYLTGITSSQGGYSGAAAYAKMRQVLVTNKYICSTPGFDFCSGSPKWDLIPRSGNTVPNGGGAPPPVQVAAPTFSPPGATYTSTQTVTISTVTAGATICYTTDGSNPTGNGMGACTHGTSGTAGTSTASASVSVSETLKAIGTKSGDTDSTVAQAVYVIGFPITTLTPASVLFNNVIVNQSSNINVTLQNTGNATLNWSSILASGAPFTINTGIGNQTTCATSGAGSLLAGQSCIIQMNFAPTVTGTAAGTLTVTDNASGSPHVVTLSGSGILVPSVSTGVTIQGSVLK